MGALDKLIRRYNSPKKPPVQYQLLCLNPLFNSMANCTISIQTYHEFHCTKTTRKETKFQKKTIVGTWDNTFCLKSVLYFPYNLWNVCRPIRVPLTAQGPSPTQTEVHSNGQPIFGSNLHCPCISYNSELTDLAPLTNQGP